MNPGYTKEAWAKRMRDWRNANPRSARSIDLKKRFGITLDEYEDILQKQNHVCGICKLPERTIDYRTGLSRNLAVDHNHETGKVRGLLCTTCNTALGLLQDDVELIMKAAEYIKERN